MRSSPASLAGTPACATHKPIMICYVPGCAAVLALTEAAPRISTTEGVNTDLDRVSLNPEHFFSCCVVPGPLVKMLHIEPTGETLSEHRKQRERVLTFTQLLYRRDLPIQGVGSYRARPAERA